SCAHRPHMIVQPAASSCHQVMPAGSPMPVWIGPGDARDLAHLGSWCRTVGPVLVESPPASACPTAATGIIRSERLVVLTWNVHVGGGDIEDVVARLRRGEFTDGRAVSQFVLLLQEAHRVGNAVPAELPADSPVPRAIIERPPNGMRRDIRS